MRFQGGDGRLDEEIDGFLSPDLLGLRENAVGHVPQAIAPRSRLPLTEWSILPLTWCNRGMSILETIPSAIHRGEEELPFVAVGDGTHLQLLQVDIANGLWVIRTRFEPGTIVPTHKHTGPVYAFTLSGAWKYVESPEVNVAGSFLFEPAGSQHTLMVPAENDGLTDAWFAIYGANLNLDEDGNVTSIIDAGTVRDGYFLLCEAQGLPRPNVIGA